MSFASVFLLCLVDFWFANFVCSSIAVECFAGSLSRRILDILCSNQRILSSRLESLTAKL